MENCSPPSLQRFALSIFGIYRKKCTLPLKLRQKGDDEINPFKLARGEAGAIGDDGVQKWEIWLGGSGGMKAQGSVEENPPEEDRIKRLLGDLFDDGSSAVLLMSRDVYDRLESVCQALGFELEAHHYDGELVTSS